MNYKIWHLHFNIRIQVKKATTKVFHYDQEHCSTRADIKHVKANYLKSTFWDKCKPCDYKALFDKNHMKFM